MWIKTDQILEASIQIQSRTKEPEAMNPNQTHKSNQTHFLRALVLLFQWNLWTEFEKQNEENPIVESNNTRNKTTKTIYLFRLCSYFFNLGNGGGKRGYQQQPQDRSGSGDLFYTSWESSWASWSQPQEVSSPGSACTPDISCKTSSSTPTSFEDHIMQKKLSPAQILCWYNLNNNALIPHTFFTFLYLLQ